MPFTRKLAWRTSQNTQQQTGDQFYHAGQELYEQEKYEEAEPLLRKAVDLDKLVLGDHDKDTIHSMSLLGQTLVYLKTYDQAEEIYRDIVALKKQFHGENQVGMAVSMSWLGIILSYQTNKDEEAEELLRTATDILNLESGEIEQRFTSIYWLGKALYKLKKYSEAEKSFRQAIALGKQIFGETHKKVADRMFWLGRTLYDQKKFDEAKDVFWQVLEYDKLNYGERHKDTAYSMEFLGKTLERQGSLHEAEKLFRSVLDVRGHACTEGPLDLGIMEQLGNCLYHQAQKNYKEAEKLLQMVVQESDKTLGEGDIQLAKRRQMLQEIQKARAQDLENGELSTGNRETTITATSSQSAEPSVRCLNDIFTEKQQSLVPYSESEIYDIASPLERSNPPWSKVPRTYTILRTINQLELLDDFIDIGFTDHWLPVLEKKIPQCLHPTARAEFIKTQELVLTKSLYLEKGTKGKHCDYMQGERLPFKSEDCDSAAGLYKVTSLISFKSYLLRRLSRTRKSGKQWTEDMSRSMSRLEILRSLRHQHITRLVGSYTDPKHFGLIFAPLPEYYLLDALGNGDVSERPRIRHFFGCLASAVHYLHGKNHYHGRIRTSSIFCHRGSVILADCGWRWSMTKFEAIAAEINGSAVSTPERDDMSWDAPLNCAPETGLYGLQNASSDIWGLGIVFLVLISVLKDMKIPEVNEFLGKPHSDQLSIVERSRLISDLVTDLRGREDASSNGLLDLVEQMLQVDHELRPSASSVLATILSMGKDENGRPKFCRTCCLPIEDEFSDLEEF